MARMSEGASGERPHLVIRRAAPSESAALTALAVRSKAHWGYDAAFMQAALSDLEIPAQIIARAEAHVAERDGAVVGVYVLTVDSGAELRDLWIDPSSIGAGVGTALWRHMLATARARGIRTVALTSDPHAEGFYARMGARRTGMVASNVNGRMLQRFEIDT